MLMHLLVGGDHKWFFFKSFILYTFFCIFQLSIMGMGYCKKKNENIRQYKWQFWKTELKSPSLWPGIIKWAKNSVETDLPKGRRLTSAHLLTSPFYLPATQTTCSSLDTCSLTPPGLHTCCSSALQALSWTAYLENFFSSFKISKHPDTPLLLIPADWSTPSIRQFICIPNAAIIWLFTFFPISSLDCVCLEDSVMSHCPLHDYTDGLYKAWGSEKMNERTKYLRTNT